MFDRFRHQYPLGSITSSLVQIHGDQYIVSVALAVEGVVLVSTLAADEKIEVAEMRAMTQALQVLGGEQFLPTPFNPTVAPAVAAPTLESRATSSPVPAEIPENTPNMTDLPLPSASPEPLSMPLLVQEPAEPAYHSPPLEPAANPELPMSMTDIIPLINMELKRLNWSREKGRDCIIALYNKRSSSLLTDEELLGLLRHLQAQTEPD